MSESSIRTPIKAQEEICRRGYMCALFYNGVKFDLVRVYRVTGEETKTFRDRVKTNPQEFVGVFSHETDFDVLDESMQHAKEGFKNAG